MSSDRIALIVLLIAAALGGAFFLLQGRATEAQEDALRSEAAAADAKAADAKLAKAAARETKILTEGESADLSAILAHPQVQRFGIKKVPDGMAIILGRVVTSAATVDSEETQGNPSGDEDASIEPINGAKVFTHRMGEDDIADDQGVLLATTGTDGWFVATVDASWGYELHFEAERHQEWRVTLAKSGLKSGAVDLGLIDLEALATISVEVSSGAKGLGEDVVPVAGMELQVFKRPPSATETTDPKVELETVQTINTDTSGKAELKDLAASGLVLRGTLAPYATFERPLDGIKDGQVIKVNIDMVGQVRVQVKSAAGAPLKTYQVALDFQHNTYGYRAPAFVDVESEDDEGWHVIKNVKAGEHVLYAVAGGFGLSQQDGVVVEPGATTTVSVNLPLGYRVRGRVVAKGSNQPVAGAIVYSETNLIPSTVDTNTRTGFEPMARATTSEADGTFELKDLTPGSHRISAVHPKHATKSVRNIKVGPNQPDAFTIKMPVGAHLEGHVYGKDGQPMAGASVMIIDILDGANTKKKAPLMTMSNEEGFYRIEHVAPGFKLVIRALAKPMPGEAMSDSKNVGFKDGSTKTLDFGKASKGATVEGLITGKDGNPQTGILVMIMSLDGARGQMPEFYQAPTNEKGEYVAKGVPGGNYMVQIARVSKGSDFAGQQRIAVPEFGLLRHDIVVDSAAITGTVVSATDGSGLTPGTVMLLDSEQQFAGRLTLDPGGRFTFSFVNEGTYTLVAQAERHQTKTIPNVRVTSGQTTQIPPIALAPGGRIVGTVRDAQGEPAAGVVVQVKDSKGKVLRLQGLASGEDGSFMLDSVPIGTWTVTGSQGARTFGEVPASVTAGDTVTVTITEQQ